MVFGQNNSSNKILQCWLTQVDIYNGRKSVLVQMVNQDMLAIFLSWDEWLEFLYCFDAVGYMTDMALSLLTTCTIYIRVFGTRKILRRAVDQLRFTWRVEIERVYVSRWWKSYCKIYSFEQTLFSCRVDLFMMMPFCSALLPRHCGFRIVLLLFKSFFYIEYYCTKMKWKFLVFFSGASSSSCCCYYLIFQ